PALSVVALASESAWSEVRFGEAVAWVRRFLVTPSDGRPLTALAAMVKEAVRVAEERAATGPANTLEPLRRLDAVLAHICSETPPASLSPEVFGELKNMLLIWALGVDLSTHFQRQSLRVQPRLSEEHPVIELLYILGA